jgi:hypothetical protein
MGFDSDVSQWVRFVPMEPVASVVSDVDMNLPPNTGAKLGAITHTQLDVDTDMVKIRDVQRQVAADVLAHVIDNLENDRKPAAGILQLVNRVQEASLSSTLNLKPSQPSAPSAPPVVNIAPASDTPKGPVITPVPPIQSSTTTSSTTSNNSTSSSKTTFSNLAERSLEWHACMKDSKTFAPYSANYGKAMHNPKFDTPPLVNRNKAN